MRFAKQVVWISKDDVFKLVVRERGNRAQINLERKELDLDQVRELKEDLEDMIQVMVGKEE